MSMCSWSDRVPSMLRLTRKVATLARVLPTFVFICAENAARPKWKVHCLAVGCASWSSNVCVFICNWIKKRREPRANHVTLKQATFENSFFVCIKFTFANVQTEVWTCDGSLDHCDDSWGGNLVALSIEKASPKMISPDNSWQKKRICSWITHL